MNDDVALKAATNLPAQFTVLVPAATATDCPPRLRDDGIGITLILQRSIMRNAPGADSLSTGYRAYGDYATEPRGRYGEQPGEGLRVDCSRLRALGVIRL